MGWRRVLRDLWEVKRTLIVIVVPLILLPLPLLVDSSVSIFKSLTRYDEHILSPLLTSSKLLLSIPSENYISFYKRPKIVVFGFFY